MRVRFAPSPTGHLHVGNARTALFNWLLARGHHGTFILRIEDTDFERSTKASEQAILDDLRWMGLQWDEGVEAGGDRGPYRQAERLPLYAEYTAAADCRTARATTVSAPPRHSTRSARRSWPRRCRQSTPAPAVTSRSKRPMRRRSAGAAAVVRLRVPEEREVTFHDVVRGPVTFHTDVIGDPVLVRSDGIPAYNFAVVIDDALMAITHVIRGEDHISNTPRQILLYEAFGWTPPAFAHLSLVMGPDHAPLSKRHGATSVREFREKGYLPEALVNYLALIGWSPGQNEELLPADELARRFKLDTVAHSAGVFDEDKLAWANRHYLKLTPPDRLAALAEPFLRQRAQIAGELTPRGAWLARNGAAGPGHVGRSIAAAGRSARHRVCVRCRGDPCPGRARGRAAGAECRAQWRRALADDLQTARHGSPPRMHFAPPPARVKERTGQKGKALFHPIRLVLTGAGEGPELDLLVPAIDSAVELPRPSGLASVKVVASGAAADCRAAMMRA